MQHGGIYLYTWEHVRSLNGHMHAPVAALAIAHSHVHLHYNTQAAKQGMVARPQAQQNVGRCRDGENVFKVSASSYFNALYYLRKGWFSNTSFTTGLKNLADVLTRCSGLLQGEDEEVKKTRASGRNVGKVFQPCCEAGIREPTLSDA